MFRTSRNRVAVAVEWVESHKTRSLQQIMVGLAELDPPCTYTYELVRLHTESWAIENSVTTNMRRRVMLASCVAGRDFQTPRRPDDRLMKYTDRPAPIKRSRQPTAISAPDSNFRPSRIARQPNRNATATVIHFGRQYRCMLLPPAGHSSRRTTVVVRAQKDARSTPLIGRPVPANGKGKDEASTPVSRAA